MYTKSVKTLINKALLDVCKPLMEYSWIVKGIREKAKMPENPYVQPLAGTCAHT